MEYTWKKWDLSSSREALGVSIRYKERQVEVILSRKSTRNTKVCNDTFPTRLDCST